MGQKNAEKIAKQLFVPFSAKSFGKNDFLVKDLKKNLINLFVNITAFFTSTDLGEFIIRELLSPWTIAYAVIGLTFDLTMLALSLVTRSLASLYYMATYTPDDGNNLLRRHFQDDDTSHLFSSTPHDSTNYDNIHHQPAINNYISYTATPYAYR